MSENGDHVFLNPEREKSPFPEELRVLAVDDNVVCLKVIEAQLLKCGYIVTVTTKATEALQMLRKNKENYDIVITDVEMPDMDGFELLQIIGLEMDMPVIMMSASDDTETVMMGVKHGARDYLVKPVRLTEIKNIWQHVMRKKLADHPTKLGTRKEEKEEKYPNPVPSKSMKKQKDRGKEQEDQRNDQFDEETSAHKKRRLVWSKDLHNKFVDVVQQLGIEKAVPKKILEKINDPRLTRENIASHLQKFRNLLRKENEKANMNQGGANLSKTNMYLSDPTAVSSGLASFGTHYQSVGTFSANNRRPLMHIPNQHENMLRQNLVTPSTVPNSPSPIFAQNSFSQTQLDWMRFQSNAPSFNSGQFGPTTMRNVPYSCPPSEAFNRAAVPFQGSSQFINHPHQLDSLALISSHGQYEGRNLVNCNGRGDTIAQFVQCPLENIERENNDYLCNSNYNFPDDDLSVMIRQLSSNAPPTF